MVTSRQNWAQRVSLAAEVGQRLLDRGQTLSTAESCTGGGIGYVITEVAGSSGWFNGGLITYTNALKQQWLEVPESVLRTQGAVSRECVEAMAMGACKAASSDWGLAVSGIAGPGGGTADKPVGLVWMAIASGQQVDSFAERFEGDREAVRLGTIDCILQRLLKKLQD